MTYHQNDAYTKVTGPERHGLIRGLRLGPTPSSLPSHSRSISFVGASRPEDAQEIAALRAELAQAVYWDSGLPLRPFLVIVVQSISFVVIQSNLFCCHQTESTRNGGTKGGASKSQTRVQNFIDRLTYNPSIFEHKMNAASQYSTGRRVFFSPN
jgi:hypothetical protein